MAQDRPEHLVADPAGIARAAELLRQGELVALPTETVYGLAADATSDLACARVFEAKGRPRFNPLIVHLAEPGPVAGMAEMPGAARALAKAFWPGPLTLVLPLKPGHGLSPLVSAGLPTAAFRVPAHPVARAVLAAFGGPVAAPSANPSGRISPTTAAHVAEGLGAKVAAILDGGACPVGLESTILAPGPTGTRLLRDGGVPREAIEEVAGPLLPETAPGPVEAPGQLASHYAPEAALITDAAPNTPDAVIVGFGPGQAADLTLSAAGDLVEAAANLFGMLHEADALARARGLRRIAVAPIPETGLGRAINDRLRRAAAPRPQA